MNKIKLAVFDWAGTTVDYGSAAPCKCFSEVFLNHGIKLTKEQINGPMGMEKKAHIRALLSLENAKEQWQKSYGRGWNEDDVQNLYVEFEDSLYKIVADYAIPIDGVVPTIEKLKQMGIKIGSTTGYTSVMMQPVIAKAKSLGYEPQCVVTPDVTKASRPGPFMLFECMRQLDVYPPEAVIKVGDTVVDIQEGKNAGAYAVGVLEGSNILSLSKDEYQSMDPKELAKLKEIARIKYYQAGADYVIDSICQLPQIIQSIESK